MHVDLQPQLGGGSGWAAPLWLLLLPLRAAAAETVGARLVESAPPLLQPLQPPPLVVVVAEQQDEVRHRYRVDSLTLRISRNQILPLGVRTILKLEETARKVFRGRTNGLPWSPRRRWHRLERGGGRRSPRHHHFLLLQMNRRRLRQRVRRR